MQPGKLVGDGGLVTAGGNWQPHAAGAQGGGLTPQVLTSASDGAWSGTTLTTASVSFGANDLALAIVASRFSEAVAEGAIASVTGGGMTTWELVGEISYASDSRVLAVFRAQQASPGASAPIVFTEANTGDGSGPTYAIIKIPGVLVGNNGADAITGLDMDAVADTPLAQTIADTPAAGDICMGIIAVLDNTLNLTSDANYDTLITVGPAAETTLRVDWDAGQDLNVTWTFTSNVNAQGSGISFLVKKAT